MSIRLIHLVVAFVFLSSIAIADEPVLFGRAVVETKDMEQLTKHCNVLLPRSIPVVDSVLPSTFSFTIEISTKGVKPVQKKKAHPSIRVISQWFADRCTVIAPIRGKKKITIRCTESIFGNPCRFYTDLNLKPNQLAWNYPEPKKCAKPPDLEDFVSVEREPGYSESDLLRSIEYPEIARRKGVQGIVLVGALISKTGCIEKMQIIESDNVILNESALDAVGRQTFTPAMADGKPVRIWTRIPIRYTLR